MNGSQQLWAIFWIALFSYWAFDTWCRHRGKPAEDKEGE